MPEFTQNTVVQFNKGLVTEASELTFPEGASIDQLNCDLKKDGSIRRRLGIELESGSTLSSRAVTSTSTVTTEVWENVAEQADTNWVVVQLNQFVKFYDLGGGAALSANAVQQGGGDYELDLSAYDRPNGNGASFAPIQVASIKGGLIIASEEINTILVEYDPVAATFSVTEIDFMIRDFEYQEDISLLTAESTSSSPGDSRIYDTQNTGWVDTKGAAALADYRSANSNLYPALTLPWYAGKNSSGNFMEGDWQKVFSGNTLIANGHYILDLYEMDRQTASGLAGVTNVTEDARFSTVEAYSGRVFYSGMRGSTGDNGNKVFFSQLLEFGFEKLGKLYQVNDPTSENLSDLLDTDGGFITIPDANDIRKLHAFGADLYVFAANGVWQISGVDNVFRATEYSIQRISEDGIVSVGSFVSASGRPYWWSNTGIYTLTVGEGGGILSQNISINTIQTFWDNINSANRSRVRGIYDQANRRVNWLFSSENETNENKRNRVLIFDEVLTAFVPWAFSDQSSNTDYVVDAAFNTGVSSADTTYNVIDSSGNQVIDSSGNTVVVTRSGQSLSSSQIKFLVVDGATGNYTFADITDVGFNDWGDTDFSSYAESAYTFFGDAETRKTAPYVTSYLKTTETGFVLNGAGDGYDTVRPSGLKVSSFWDFKKVASTAAQQAYRQKYTPTVDTGDLDTYGYPVELVITRIKMRGRGRVMKLRFESEAGKDFHLIGWNVIGNRAGRF